MNTRLHLVNYLLLFYFLVIPALPNNDASTNRLDPAAPTWTLSYASASANINSLSVYNGNLYAIANAGNQTNGRIYRFDGSNWVDLNFASAISTTVDMIQAMVVYNNRLYIGTRVSVSGIKYARIYYYDGTSFTLDYSRPGNSGYSGIENFTIHNNKLFAANGSYSYGEVYQRNEDGDWTILGGIIETNTPVRALASYRGWLYAGTGASGNSAKIWRWNGVSWTLVINIRTHFAVNQDGVCDLLTNDDKLFVGLCGPGSPSPILVFDGYDWLIDTTLSCATVTLSEVDGIPWVGGCGGVVLRRENQGWVSTGSTNTTATMHIARYSNTIYAGTMSGGAIYRTTNINPIFGQITSPSIGETISTSPISFSADLWSVIPGAIKNVALRVFYDGTWHNVGILDQAPYSVSWQVPENLEPQQLQFAVDATDIDNVTTTAIGGVRQLIFDDRISQPAEITENWIPNRVYINQRPLNLGYDPYWDMQWGDEMCGATSMTMVLAMNGQLDISYATMKQTANDMFPNTLIGHTATIAKIKQELNNNHGVIAESLHLPTSLAWINLKEEVDAGRPVIFRTEHLTSSGHYIVGVGYREIVASDIVVHQVIVYDPAGKWKGVSAGNYDYNSSTDPKSHKGQWVFYNFDYVFGGYMITARPTSPGQVFIDTPLPILTPPDLISDEPETLGYFPGIPVDFKTFLPLTIR